jgi:hypothetical protein
MGTNNKKVNAAINPLAKTKIVPGSKEHCDKSNGDKAQAKQG